MILVCEGTCAPVPPPFKGQGGNDPVTHPHSGVPALSPSRNETNGLKQCRHDYGGRRTQTSFNPL